MDRLSPLRMREERREERRALMNGELGMAAWRSDLVRLALRLIVEEALEGKVADVLGRERYAPGDGEKNGYPQPAESGRSIAPRCYRRWRRREGTSRCPRR